MASTSLVDYLSEKLYSFSSKMWGSSLQPNSTSFLMSGNTNFQQYDLLTVLSEAKDKYDYHFAIHPTYPFLPLHRFATGMFGSFRLLNGMNKTNNFTSYMTERGFSPSKFNLVADSYLPKYGSYDSSFTSPDSKFLNSTKESVYSESHVMNKKTEAMEKGKLNSLQVVEMTVGVSNLPAKENLETVKQNCDISPSKRLNIELAHRKTKEISKRSKKRRRRQKKIEHLSSISNSTSNSSSDDDATNDECTSPASDSLCFSSKRPDFGSTLSVTHTFELSPSCFLIPVKSDSDDDSEWETFDETEISAANKITSETDSSASSSCNSTPVKRESSFIPVDCNVHVSSIISFVIPSDDSEDDSDWDTCETSTFPENSDFELSGLYFANLCVSKSYKNECDSDFFPEEDSEEQLQLRADVLEANSKWSKLDDGRKSKAASKVTFAPDEDLVEVFQVEIFERKGEWEMYATARDRFKRKINELEKVISPCLMPKHRSKIFKKFVEPEL